MNGRLPSATRAPRSRPRAGAFSGRLVVVGVLAVSFYACSWTNSFSEHPYFAPYVGVDAKLQRPARLCRAHDSNHYRFRRIRLVNPRQSCEAMGWDAIAELSVGDTVRIERVVENGNGFAGSVLYALGRYGDHDFEYWYGWRGNVWAAPWEPVEGSGKRCLEGPSSPCENDPAPRN